MAKFLKKKNQVEAFLIDFSKPQLWPSGVIQNQSSPTGVSYGSLAILPGPTIDGLPLKDGWYLILDSDGKPDNIDPATFARIYEQKEAAK